MEKTKQRHAPTALHLGKNPPAPTGQEVSGSQVRYEQSGEQNTFGPAGNRIPASQPALSPSLTQLSYPGRYNDVYIY
jgi:hypothetical protein